MVGIRALVIDDEEIIREAIQEYIKPYFSEEVILSGSLAEATELVKSTKFDLISLDIGLGRGNGAALVKFIEENETPNKETPIIICSGYINPAFQEKIQSRFAAVIVKPFNKLQFERVLNELKAQKATTITKAPTPLWEIQHKTNKTIEKVKKYPKLKELLKELHPPKDADPIEQRNDILIKLLAGLANELEWFTEQTLSKLILASYLHDSALSSKPELSKYWDRIEVELDKENMSNDDYELVRNHPILACEELEKQSSVEEDVLTIIRQHHERPDGTGFPNGLKGTKITPLSALFIMALDLTVFIQRSPNNWSMTKYLEKRKGKMSSPNFQKIIDVLEHHKK